MPMPRSLPRRLAASRRAGNPAQSACCRPRARVERHLGMDARLATLAVGEECLLPLARPSDRPAELLRRERHQRVLREGEALHPEAAADILRDDADAVLGDGEPGGEVAAHAEDALRAEIDGVAIRR